MTIELFPVVVLCIIAAVLALMLRQHRPEYAILVSLACSVLAALYLTQSMAQVMEQLAQLFQESLLPDGMVQVVLKCLGVCVLTELGAQTCRDAGENAIGAKVELAGKVTLVMVSLPLFSRLLEMAGALLSLG